MLGTDARAPRTCGCALVCSYSAKARERALARPRLLHEEAQERGQRARRVVAVAQLPIAAVAPGEDAAGHRHRNGVVEARRDRPGRAADALHRPRDDPVRVVAVAELAVPVAPRCRAGIRLGSERRLLRLPFFAIFFVSSTCSESRGPFSVSRSPRPLLPPPLPPPVPSSTPPLPFCFSPYFPPTHPLHPRGATAAPESGRRGPAGQGSAGHLDIILGWDWIVPTEDDSDVEIRAQVQPCRSPRAGPPPPRVPGGPPPAEARSGLCPSPASPGRRPRGPGPTTPAGWGCGPAAHR